MRLKELFKVVVDEGGDGTNRSLVWPVVGTYPKSVTCGGRIVASERINAPLSLG
jgi:hypothetical protein